ncbi:hypothetical protein BUALT_Bualt09G0068800 [Buddleja alternifolia]|uniref:glutathione transferase n=1 Tax=Buddleja alternifolia TaxID=168488 RepID=A0AAV6X8M9_9LAMI|nr:hypothetical protein BUALT_Bualt09G0068800 [Buddleja alternifolia]
MAAPSVQEVLPPYLDSTSEPPPLFDGTTRLYTNYQCPYAQRVWITRNYKGLQDEIKLVPIDLKNRPAWYKEKVYPTNKVPALEHNGKIIGESLDLIKYVDENFKGPSLLPDDPAKLKFAEELIAYSDTFLKNMYSSFKGDTVKQAGAEFDYLETALHKFDDGPFFLGQFSRVDVAYAPFVERFQIFLQEVWKYDITSGRPKLAAWIEGLQDKIKLVAINLQDRPAWYKEKLYPDNKVPSLEHNGKVIGESLDLIKYIDTSFEGPDLLPDDPAKQTFSEEMIAYLDTVQKNVYTSLKGDPVKEAGGEFDYLETSLEKFDDGPFFLGQFSWVDAAYVPFIERFHIFLQEVFNYDITLGRPNLAAYLEEMNKIDAYKQTKCDPKFLVQYYKTRFMGSS